MSPDPSAEPAQGHPTQAPSRRGAWIVLACLLVLLGLGSGLALTSWHAARPLVQHVTFFYADAQAMFLVPVERDLALPPVDDASGWARAVFEGLKKVPDAKLAAGVTGEIALLDAQWRSPGWTLIVRMPAGAGSTSERMLAGSLVRTFIASYPGCETVSLRLLGPDGKPWASQHLDLGGPLTAADFTNRTEGDPSRGLPATVWWPAQGASELVPVQLSLTGGTGSPARDVLERLLAGPPADAGAFLQPVVPPGVKAHWGGMTQDVAIVALDSNLPRDAAGIEFVKAVVLTLTELPNVHAVQLRRGTGPLDGVLGVFPLARPLTRELALRGRLAPSSAKP